MTTTSAAQLLHELTAIKAYLQAACEVLAAGQMPEITGIEKRVAVLCEAIQAAPESVQQECLPELAHLLKSFDACERDMRHFYETLESSVKPDGKS